MTQSTNITLHVDDVEYRIIPSYPWLFISDKAGLISIKSGRVNFVSKTKNSAGYEVFNVGVTEQTKNVVVYVHRLLAEAWLEAEEGKSHVNHKDSDRTNNCVTNLEWCTPKENATHAVSVGRMGRNRMSVQCVNEATGIGRRFSSMMEAERFGLRR